MLSSEQELKRMKERTMQEKISVLKCPKFWRESKDNQNLRTNLLKGDVKYEVSGGICTKLIVISVNVKMNVKEYVNIEIFVHYL